MMVCATNAPADGNETGSADMPDELVLVLARRLLARGGPDLLSFKDKVRKRRLRLRMRAAGCESLGKYLEALDADPSEWARLAKALTIQVSGFFRNPEVFSAIRETVLPRLFEANRMRALPSLIVSAGAARGEEIYSLALLVRHHFRRDWERGVRFEGIDCDRPALAEARRAVFDPVRVRAVPRRLFKPNFTKVKDGYALNRDIAERVVFSERDLAEGPGIGKIDLLLCRNLLIYYGRERQKEILDGLYEALTPGGYLALGKTETLCGKAKEELLVVDSEERIYRKPGD